MKKFLLSVIGMVLMTSITFAQQGKESNASCSKLYDKIYWHVFAELSPVKLTAPHASKNIGYDYYYSFESISTDMPGISLGFTTGIRMMKTQPLYLEVGAKLLYALKKEVKPESEEMGEIWKGKKEYLALNIPIVATWQFEVVPKVCVAPYLGLNMRYNIYGKSKIQQNIFSYIWDEEIREYVLTLRSTETCRVNWFKKYDGNYNRFNVGLTFGANFTFNRFILGLGYTKDVTKFMREPGEDSKIEYFTISAGCRF